VSEVDNVKFVECPDGRLCLPTAAAHAECTPTMLLDLTTFDIPMKRVYDLEADLKANPEHVRIVQELTLNKDRPLMGLAGRHGLFGSREWFENMQSRRMKVDCVSGKILRTYFAGQDSRGPDNCFELELSDGTLHQESIYVSDRKDARLFRVGSTVAIAYAYDELKLQPANDDGVNYSLVVVEMAVSET